MKQTAKKLNLSERITSLITSIHEEAVCPDFKQKILLDKLEAEEKAKEQKCEEHCTKDSTPESGENKNTVCNGKKDCQKVADDLSIETGRKNEGASVKRTIDSVEEEAGADEPVVVRKKMRLADCDDNNSEESPRKTAPHFFYNANKRKIKGVDIPKYVFTAHIRKMWKVLFSQVYVCPHLGGRYPSFLFQVPSQPLAPWPFWGWGDTPVPNSFPDLWSQVLCRGGVCPSPRFFPWSLGSRSFPEGTYPSRLEYPWGKSPPPPPPRQNSRASTFNVMDGMPLQVLCSRRRTFLVMLFLDGHCA